jgi:hypothetical protein
MASNDKINFKIGPFVASHVHVNRPDDKFEKEKPKFTLSFIEDPNHEVMKDARAQVNAAAKALGTKKGQGTPISGHTEKNDDGIKIPTGKYVLKAKSLYAPSLKGPRGQDLDRSKFQVNDGSLVVIYGYFEPYSMGTGGFTARLQTVQVLKKGEGSSQSSGSDRGPAVDVYDEYEFDEEFEEPAGDFDEPPFDTEGSDDLDDTLDL